ncbi:MAG TPA: hypothetical protein VF690_09395 [Hymenobacter sp.]|jgi:hypothetical protein
MGLTTENWYASARKEHPYTHLLQTKIRSLGQAYGLRLPDLLLTMQYHLDPHGNVMREPKLVFQPDGPSDAQLNFRHHTLRFEYTHSVCRFSVSMDALYGEGAVIKQNTTIGGTLGAEKVVKGEFEASTEFGKEAPGTRTSLHARLEGLLSAKNNQLEVWGHLV